jgi:hypothetical protein
MRSDFSITKRRQRIAALPLAFALLGALMCYGSTASASIAVPNFLTFAADDLDHNAADSGCGTADDSQKGRQNDQDRPDLPTRFALPSAPASMGGASSSSALTGGFAAAVAVNGQVSAVVQPAANVLGWLSGEQRLALPEPPGNDLLRPPQAV